MSISDRNQVIKTGYQSKFRQRFLTKHILKLANTSRRFVGGLGVATIDRVLTGSLVAENLYK